MTYPATLKGFHSAILDNDPASAREDIKPHAKLHKDTQLAVYIQGYRLRLASALRTDYPELIGIIGNEEFNRLASEYIESTPSESFNLDRYPNGFGEFAAGKLEGFAHDIAKLENAIAWVFMAEESEAVDSSVIASLTPEAFAQMKLQPRAASRLLVFDYPVNHWFNAKREGNNLPKPAPQKEYAYLYRHLNTVQRVILTAPAYIFLEQLFSGKTVEAALEQVVTNHPEYTQEILGNIQAWFGEWIRNAFFTSQISENYP